MRRFALICVTLLIGFGAASAQAMLQLIVNSQTPGAAYTGPGDVVSGASAWWGLRAYSNAKALAGAAAVRLRRASDTNTQDIAVLTNGNLDTSSAATFCAATTCTIITWYDQSGNGIDLVDPGGAVRYTQNCINTSLPCGDSTACGSACGAITNVLGVIPQPLTMSAVGLRAAAFTSFSVLINTLPDSGGASNPRLYFNNVTGQAAIAAGSAVTGTASNSAWHAFQAVFGNASGTANVLSIDNTETTGTTGTQSTNTKMGIFQDNGGANPLNGKMTEAGIWPSAFTGTQRTNMCHNQFSYWATSTSC